jgi:hypothetical protein
MLGLFTDTWDDLVNDNGDPLRFGMMHYTNTATSTFRERVKPRDVKTALVLLNYLFLEHYTVENLLLVDSSMLLIKESSEGAGVHFNSIGKPNHMFAWFVIDYLSMCILFISCRITFVILRTCSHGSPHLEEKQRYEYSERYCSLYFQQATSLTI